MLDRKLLRDEPERIREGVAAKGDPGRLDEWAVLDRDRRALIAEVEELKQLRNQRSEAIGAARKRGEDASEAMAAMKEVSANIKEGDARLAVFETELDAIERWLPNLPAEGVPRGGEEANVVRRTWKEPRSFSFEAKPHWDLCEEKGWMRAEAASRMSGSGFSVLTGPVARLERALINWFLDVHVEEQGYLEINAPYMVREEALAGTGQLPKLAEDMYRTDVDGLYLIPTAEVSVTNLHREEIFEAGRLPLRYVSFSPCFRREAGSAGKDTRGILRMHQFHKVEMVRFTTEELGASELDALVEDATVLLERLELPYRILELASGDLSFAAARCYDLEVYSPGVDQWLEVSSCSWFGDFQGRRANIRYRPEAKGKPRFVHTLNGSGLALPRVLIAILENYQREDGSIEIPAVLRPYMGGREMIG